jgi:hypothetical protein
MNRNRLVIIAFTAVLALWQAFAVAAEPASSAQAAMVKSLFDNDQTGVPGNADSSGHIVRRIEGNATQEAGTLRTAVEASGDSRL